MVGKNKHQKQYLNHTQVIFKSSNTKSGIFGKVPHFWLSALITLERFNILQRGQKHDKIQAIWDQQTIKDIAESLFEFSVAMSCSFEKSPIIQWNIFLFIFLVWFVHYKGSPLSGNSSWS